MGFFSWRCAKSKKPVMADVGVQGSPWEFASDVVVLFKDGSVVKGSYDGYGRVFGDAHVELVDYPESQWRMVITRYYNGETFDQLAPNGHDPGQGFFYDDEDLEELFDSKNP